MGLLRIMMPPKFQLLALLAFAVAMFFLENQIQKLEESRGKLGKTAVKMSLFIMPQVNVSVRCSHCLVESLLNILSAWLPIWG